LVLTDYLLSLRGFSPESNDPAAAAGQAEADPNRKRQVAFYKGRLESFMREVSAKVSRLDPPQLPSSWCELENKVADMDNLSLVACQAFESLTPLMLGYLMDLRHMVQNTKDAWDRATTPGYISLAESLPRKSPNSSLAVAAKVITDLRDAFAPNRDALYSLAAFIDEDDITALTEGNAGQIALRALWRVKRGIPDAEVVELRQYSNQLIDVIETTRGIKVMKQELEQQGMVVNVGILAILVEEFDTIVSVSGHASELTKSPTAADRQLARALYLRFLKAFLENVGPAAVRAKSDVANLRRCLNEIEDTKQRLVDSAETEYARFAEIAPESMRKLVDAAVGDGLGAEDGILTLSDILKRLEATNASLLDLESHMQELSDTYSQIQAALKEKRGGC
jgi:hypothetical protein